MEWLEGLLQVLSPMVLLFLLFGVVSGLFVGALPGLSATMAVAILTPLTFWLPREQGFAMLIGVWNSALFAGGISAILINTPGTPASIATTFDGYSLYKSGKGGLALGVNVIYSVIGGLVSILFLVFLSFPLAHFTIKFGPSEYFALALFGLSMMITVSGNSVIKGLLVGIGGVLVSTIGIDPILSVKRFTMGSTQLMSGISFLPVMIGMFGIGEVLTQIFDKRRSQNNEKDIQRTENLELGRILPNRKEVKSMAKPTLIASVVATIVGAIPAAGGDIASIICWGQAKKMSKHPEEYGKGSMEGLAVSCAANNGTSGGAMTTMLTLGIPGDSVTAILIGSLMMYGLQPGPRMFIENKPFVINIMLLMVLAYIFIGVIGLITVKISTKMLNVRKETIWVAVILFCIVGSYALNNNFADVIIMLIAGLLGFLFKKGGFAAGPFILGLLLGGMLESNMRRALVISNGNVSIFFTRPITLVLMLMIVLSFVYPVIRKAFANRKKKKIVVEKG